MAYILLSANPPFNGSSEDEILKKVASGSYSFLQGWQGVSDKAKDFIKNCMCVDPKQRWSAEQALNSEWMQAMGTLPIDQDNAKRSLENMKKF